MTVVLRIASHETGRHVTKKLRKGMNDITLPAGAHVEVVDSQNHNALRPAKAEFAHGKLILDYNQGDDAIQLRIAGEAIDGLDSKGPLDLSAINTAFDNANPGEGAWAAADWGNAEADAQGAGGSDNSDDRHHGLSGTLLLLLGLGAAGGLAGALAGGGGSAAAPATPPTAPVVTLGNGVGTNGANAAEATQASGVVTVNAASGTTIDVTFTNGTHTLTKSVTGTGSAVAVVLTSADLTTLGDGAISVSAVAKANGLSSSAATNSFTLDTTGPAAPTLALSTDTGASATDRVTSNGSVSVTAENGSTVALTFTNGSHTVTKSVTGTGSAQTVTLSSGDMATLGDGAVSVSAVATDAAGNAGSAGTLSYTLDTVTAVGITSQPILVGGAPVLSGTAETGDTVVVTIAGATYRTTATGGAWSVNTATATPTSGTLALNANGINAVGVTATDAAGNSATASQNLQLVSSSSGVVNTSATNVAVQVNAIDGNVPITINAPNATSLTITGNPNGSPVDVTVADKTPGAVDTYPLTLITNVSPAANPGQPNLLILDFASAQDRVVLSSASSVQGFNQIEVRNGTLDLSGVNLTGIVNIQINSGVVLTLAQFEALSSLVSLSGLGQLTIHLDTQSQINDLITFLQSPGNLFLMGTTVTVEYGSNNTVISNSTAANLISALNYPSIPQISGAISALQTAVSGNTSAIALLINDASAHGGTATTASITGIQAALAALQTQVNQQQLDLNAITAHNLDSLQTLVGNLSSAMTALTAQVNTQATQIAANTGNIATQATQIAGILTNIGALQTAVSALQTGNSNNAAAITALQAAHDSLSATVTALQTTLQHDIATLQGANYANATYQDIASLSAQIDALNSAVAALQTLVGQSSVASQISAAIGHPTNGSGAATGLWAAIESAISTATAGLQTQINGTNANLALVIDDSSTHGGTPTLNSIAGLMAAINVLNGAGANSVAGQINAALGHPTNGSGAATGLWAGIESAISASAATLQTEINSTNANLALVIDDSSTHGGTPTLNSIAGLMAAINVLNGAGANSVAGQITAALGHPTNGSGAATGLWAGIESAISTAAATLQTEINSTNANLALVIDDSSTNGGTPTLNSIAGLLAAVNVLNGSGAGSVSTQISTAIGHPTNGSGAATGLWAGIESAINTETASLNAQIAALQGTNYNSAAYQDIASISAAITDLQALVGNTSVSSQIANAINGVTSSFNTLISALHGAGVVVTVADTEALLVSDPAQLLTNYRLVDTYANLLAATQNPADAHVFAYAKSIGFTAAAPLTVAQVTGLESAIAAIANAAPINAALNSYSLSDTVAHLALANPAILSGATNITATLSGASLDQVATVLAAANAGVTLLDAVSGTPAQILGLPLGAHDTITAITVTGLASAQQAADLANLATAGKAGSVQLGAVSDTAANIEAVIAHQGGAAFLSTATRIDVSGTLTVAEAEQLQAVNANVHITGITDSAASITSALSASQLSLTYVGALSTTDTATIAQASALQAALPGHVSILGITDTSADIGAAVLAGTLSLTGVGSVAIADGSIADYASAAQAAALGRSTLSLAYDIADTSAHYASTIATYGQSFLGKAGNIVLTGSASLAVARSLLGAHNGGTVTIETINATASQVGSLNFDAHDLVTNLNVAGLTFGNQTVDLTNVPFSTNLTYNGAGLGSSYSLMLYMPAPDGVSVDGNGVDQGGRVTINAGSGNNTFVFTDDLNDGSYLPTAYGAGSSINYATYGNNQHGTETLVIIGSVDISNIALGGDLNSYDLEAFAGSPSSVTLSATQLNKLHNFNGASGGTIINITNAPDPASGTVVVTSSSNNTLTQNINFTNVTGVNIGINDNLQIDFLRLLGLSHVSTASGGNGSQAGLVTPIFNTTGGQTYLTTDGTQNGTPISSSFLTNASYNIDMSAAAGLSLGSDGAGHYYLQDSQGNHLNLPQTLNGNTLGLSPDEISGPGAPLVMGATNGGVLQLTGLVNSQGDAVDITQVTAPISLSIGQNADLTGASNPSQITADLAHIAAIPGSSITVNNVGGGNPPVTLTMTADQASHIAISGTGEVKVVGTATGNEDYSNLTATTVDLSGINPNGHTITLPASIPAGHTLILNQAEVNGATITGTGALNILVNSAATMDLSHIDTSHLSVSLVVPTGTSATVPSGSNLANFPIVVQSGATLTIDGDVASGKTISGAGTVNITGTGTLNGGDDFSHITAHTVDLSAYSGTIAHLPTLSPTGVAALVLNTAEADFASSAAGNNLTVPSGTSLTVVVNGPASGPGATLDMSGIHTTGTGTLAVHVTGNTLLSSANLNGAPVSVDAIATLTMPVNAASGLTITGAGTVDLVGGGAVTADLSNLTVANVNWEVTQDATFTGTLGNAVVTIDHDVTLSGSAARFAGASVLAGAVNGGLGQSRGVLSITGGFTNQDFSAVGASLDLSHATSGTVTNLTLPTWVAGQALIMSYAQVNGVTLDVGAGDARIVDIASNAASDLSTITSTSGHVTAIIDANATFTGTFSSAANASVHFITGANGATYTLSLDAHLLDGRSVDGNGTVDITSVSASTDLSNVLPATIDFTHDSALTVTSGQLTEGSATVTLPTMSAGLTLALTAAQADTLSVLGSAGTVDVQGDVAANTNLTAIAAGIAISFADASDPQSGAQITVADSRSLTMASDQLTGQTILADTGHNASGVLIVLGRGGAASALTSAANLGAVAATIDLTGITNLHVAGGVLEDATTASYALTLPTLVSSQTLLVNADQLGGGALALSGSGTADVRGDVASVSLDLSGLADTLHLSLQDNIDNAIDIGTGLTLTVKALHASGQTITGSGHLVVVDDTAHSSSLVADLSHVSATTIDLTQFTGLHVGGGAALDHLVDATGTLALTLPVLANGQTLVLTTAQLDGDMPLQVLGSGTVEVTGTLDDQSINLTGIAASNTILFDGGTLTMDHGAHLTATAGQLDGQTVATLDAASTITLADAAAAPVLTAADVSAALGSNANAAILGNLVDTAANLATLDWANNGFLYSVHGTVTATTAATLADVGVLYNINFFRSGMATFSVADTLAHFAAAPQWLVDQAVERASVNGGTITITDPVSLADAAALVTANLTYQANNQQQVDGQNWNGITFTVSDSASALAALGNGAATDLQAALAFGGGSITVTGTANAAQASAFAATYGALVHYNVADTAAALVARHTTDGNWTFLTDATTVEVTGSTSAANAATLEAAGLHGLTIDMVGDSAANIASAITANARFLDSVGGVTLTSGVAVSALGSAASQSVDFVSDTVAHLMTMGAGSYTKLTANAVISATGTATAAQAQTILQNFYNGLNGGGSFPNATTEKTHLLLSIADTAAHVTALGVADLARLSGGVHITNAANATQGVELAWLGANSGAHIYYSVADTAANLTAQITGAIAARVTGTITVTTAATAEQAYTLYGLATANGVSAPVLFTLSDSAANVAAAITAHGATFLGGAAAIIVTDTVTVAQASAILAAAGPNASVSFASLSDTAAHVNAANAGLLDHVTGTVTKVLTSGSTDLSGVSANIDLRGMSAQGVALDANTSRNTIVLNQLVSSAGNTVTREAYSVLLPTLAATQTLYVDAAQLAGALAAAVAGSGHLVVAGDIAANTDLTGVGTAIDVSFKDNGESGAFGTVALGMGAHLTAHDAQISAHAITGAGTLIVLGGGNGGHLSGALDLSSVSSGIDLTQALLSVETAAGAHHGQLVDNGHYITLPVLTGQTVSLTMAELTGQLAITGTGTLDLQGDISSSLDLTYLPATIALSFLDSADAGGLATVNVSGTAQAQTVLTLSAEQASDQYITGNAYATIELPYAASATTNLSNQTDLAHVFSTAFATNAAWASALQSANAGLSGKIAATDNGVVLTGGNSDGAFENFQFTATATGTYTFTANFQNNYHGAYSYTDAYGTHTYNPDSDRYYVTTNVNGGNNQVVGWNSASGSTTYTVTMVEGETLSIYLYTPSGRTAGPDGALTTPSTLTLSDGGFSTVGGTAAQLNVTVGQDTDLSAAADPLAYVPVDLFTLANNAVLTMTGLEASGHTVSGSGAVVISGNIVSGWVDLTHVMTPMSFTNSVDDSNQLGINGDNWLRLTATQANGLFTSGGTVNIGGDVADGANALVDLTHIQSTLSFEDTSLTSRDVTAYTALNTPTTIARNELNTLSYTNGWNYGQLYLGSGNELVLRADQANWHSVSGSGTTYVVGNVDGSDLSLLGITSGLSFWDGIVANPYGGDDTEDARSTGKGSITLSDQSTMEVIGNQLDGNYILGDGSNVVRVYGALGDASHAIDLSHITTSIDLAYAYDHNVALVTGLNGQGNPVTNNGSITVGFNALTGGQKTTIANSISGTYNTLSAYLPQTWNADQTVTIYSRDATDLSLDTRNYSNGSLMLDEGGNAVGAKVLIAHVEDLLSNGLVNGDFSQINASLVTLNFGSRQGTVLNYAGSFGSATVLIDDGVNVVMDGAVASGVYFDTQYNGYRWNGSGYGVVGINTLTANADLTNTVNDPAGFNLTLPNIYGHVDIDISYGAAGSSYLPNGAAAITWNAGLGQFTNGTYAITLPGFDGSNGLIVNASQLSGGTGFTLNGSGFVGVEGNIAANLDLTALNTDFAVYFGSNATNIRNLAHGQSYPSNWDNWSAYSGTAVSTGVTLTLRPDQVYNNINISGAGTLALAAGTDAYVNEFGNVDLISVTANIDLTSLGSDSSTGGIAQDGTRGGTVINYREGNSWINYTAGYTLGNGGYELLLPTLGATQSLTVNADQLAGNNGFNLSGTVNGANRSLLDIQGTVNTHVVLTNVAKSVAVSFRDGSETGLGQTTVNASGQLVGRIDQLDHQTINGAGTVYAGITGTVPQISTADTSALQQMATAHTADLSGITANLDLTALSTTNVLAGLTINGSGKFADGTDATKLVDLPALVAGQTLSVTAREMTGQLALTKAAQNGGGTIDIQGDMSDITGTVDLTHVQDGIAVSFADNANADLSIAGSSAQLVIKGGQASGLTITGDGTSAAAYNNAGSAGSRFDGAAVVLADNDNGTLSTLPGANSATVDLSGISANLDLTGLSGLAVDGNGALSDGQGKLALGTLRAQQTVKVNAAQLASLSANGTGRVILNGQSDSILDVRGNIASGLSVNLTGIVGSTVSFVDTADVTANAISVAGTLTMLAEQFDAAGAMKISGTGALWLNATQAVTTVNWTDSAQTPGYYIANTGLSSTLDVQASTTLVAGGAGLMPTTMQIKVENSQTLTSGYAYVSGRTIYDAGHVYSYDAQTGTYTVTGGKLAVTGASGGTLDLSHVTVGTLDLTHYSGTSFSGLWSDLTDHALLMNDNQADGHAFAAGGNGGALTVMATTPTAYHDFSGIDASVNSLLTVNGAANMADAISGGNHTLLNVFSHVGLDYTTGQLTVSADQVSGMSWSRFTGTGGLYIRDDAATYHSGAETLYGTNNNDTFAGGGYGDTIDLTGSTSAKGGTDTIAFSTLAGSNGHTVDFSISGFTTGSGMGHDILNFSALSSHTAHNGAGDVSAISLGAVPSTLAQEVVVVTDSFGADASGVASVFGAGSNLLNKALAAVGNTDAVFIVALADPNDSGSGAPAVNFGVWHWQAANGSNGYVHAAELTEIGVLHGLTQTQIAAMTSANVIG